MKSLRHTLIALFVIIIPGQASAERNPHLYLRGDFTSTNFLTYLATLGTTALINNKYGDFLWDNYLGAGAFNLTAPNGNSLGAGSDELNNNLYGLKAKNIFSRFGTGIKIGYRTFDPLSFFNFRYYGSFHYLLTHCDIGIPGTFEYGHYTYDLNAFHSIRIGAGAGMRLGKIETGLQFDIDFGLEYNIPIAYSGSIVNGPSGLSSGFAPTISVKMGGPKLMRKTGMVIGLMFEFPGYDVFKESNKIIPIDNAKYYYIGINFTICPWRKELLKY